MAATPSGEVTRLLESWRGGRADALDDLLPLIYDELRSLAASYLRKERGGHTLQPTALVHEVYVRLTGKEPLAIKDRAHFFAVAARAMRRVLVDHARRHRAGKRVGPGDKISLEEAPELAGGFRLSLDVDVLALHEALARLARVNARQAKLVELRYFAGLTNAEAAEALGVSVGTVERDWHVARLWLHRRLAGE